MAPEPVLGPASLGSRGTRAAWRGYFENDNGGFAACFNGGFAACFNGGSAACFNGGSAARFSGGGDLAVYLRFVGECSC